MPRSIRALAVCLLLGTAAAFGAPQDPICEICNCPEPSCYACHSPCPSSLAKLKKNRLPRKPTPAQKPEGGFVLFASSLPLVAALVALGARRRARSLGKQR